MSIFTEIYRGNFKGVKEHLDAGFMEKNPKVAKTLLHLAVDLGRLAICGLLISRGADVNEKDVFGNTPLLIACSHEYTGIAELLLDADADPNLTGEAVHPLEEAVVRRDHETVKLLLERKADVNASQHASTSILQLSIFNGDEDVFQTLIDAKADVNRTTECGTALEVAIDQNRPKFAAVIEETIKSAEDVKDAESRPRIRRRNTFKAPHLACHYLSSGVTFEDSHYLIR